MIKEIKYYISICRPINAFITAVTIFAAYLIATNGTPDLFIASIAAIIGALTASAGNVINDIIDLETDKINQKSKPISSNKISTSNAYSFYFALNAMAIMLSVVLPNNSIIILLATIALLYFYSVRIKKIVVVSNLTVSGLTGLAFIFGGTAAHNIEPVIIPAIFAFIINLIREIVKDNIDLPGDVKTGVITIPSKYGEKFTKYLITILSLILIAAVNIPFVLRLYKVEYIIIINMLLNPLIVYSINMLHRKYNVFTLKRASSLLKICMLIGLIAIIAGK